jgi:hypothetical protein
MNPADVIPHVAAFILTVLYVAFVQHFLTTISILTLLALLAILLVVGTVCYYAGGFDFLWAKNLSLEEFRDELFDRLRAEHFVVREWLRPLYANAILAYSHFFVRHWAHLHYENYKEQCFQSFLAFEQVPKVESEGPFEIEATEVLGFEVFAHLIEEMSKPFDWKVADAMTRNYLAYMPEKFATYLPDWGVYTHDMKKLNEDDAKRAKEIGAGRVALERAFRRTPFFPNQALFMKAISELRVPYNPFSGDLRFRGQFIVGNPGTGKTNYLSVLINRDLNLVAADEASVLVMDSQNELVPDIARLSRFGPGGDLEGRLIYLEVNPEWPLALNIFDNDPKRFAHLPDEDKDVLLAGTQEMVSFFINAVAKADLSGHMETVLEHIVPAVMSIRGATVFTLQDLVADDQGGYERLKHRMEGLEEEEHEWLRRRLYSKEYVATLGAIRTRLDGLSANRIFRRMFRHPRSKFDLFRELQSSKVILINTKKAVLKKATEPFGRFFIAKLLQASEERMLIDRGRRRPVYCYIDEASDYIANEENIRELLDKGRKQLVSLNIAVQREDQITSETVLSALRHAAVQTRLSTKGFADFTLPGQPPRTVAVQEMRFDREPRMNDMDFGALRQKMRDFYCTPTAVDTNEAEILKEFWRSSSEPTTEEDSPRPDLAPAVEQTTTQAAGVPPVTAHLDQASPPRASVPPVLPPDDDEEIGFS